MIKINQPSIWDIKIKLIMWKSKWCLTCLQLCRIVVFSRSCSSLQEDISAHHLSQLLLSLQIVHIWQLKYIVFGGFDQSSVSIKRCKFALLARHLRVIYLFCKIFLLFSQRWCFLWYFWMSVFSVHLQQPFVDFSSSLLVWYSRETNRNIIE